MISIVSDSYMYLFKYKQVMEKGTWDRVWLKKSLMSSGHLIIYELFFFLQGYVVMLAWQMWVVPGFYYLYLRKTRSLYNIKQNV